MTKQLAARHARITLGARFSDAHTVIVDADGNVYANCSAEEVKKGTKAELFIIKSTTEEKPAKKEDGTK